MYLTVDAQTPPSVALHEPDDLEALSVRLTEGRARAETSLGAWGVLQGDVAWLSIATLRSAVVAGTLMPHDVVERFEGMIGYARRAGWVDDESGRVRAHVEDA